MQADPETGLHLDVKVPRHPSKLGLRSQFLIFDCPETIHGFDSRARPVTLYACICSTDTSQEAFDHFKIRAILGVLGGNFSSWPETLSQSVQVHFSILDAWLRRSTIMQEQRGEDTIYSQRLLPLISIQISEEATLHITCGCSLKGGGGFNELHLTQLHSVQFNFSKPRKISEVRANFAHVFRNLLSFLCGTNIFIDSISFRSAPWDECDLLGGNPGVAAAPRDWSFGKLLALYPEIEQIFPQIVITWFQYQSKMEPIINLYCSACWNPEMPATTKFLLLAQALEAYHSRSQKYETAVQNRASFRDRIDSLLKAIPEESDRKWLKEKLNHANQKTLAQRLNDIITGQKNAASQFISDLEQFAQTVKHTRNYLTHYSEELREKVPDILPFTTLTNQLRGLLELCMATDLGLPETTIKRIILRSQNPRYISLETPSSKS